MVNRETFRFGLMLCITIMLLAACTAITTSPSMGNTLANTEWTLVSSGKPGAEMPVVAGSRVTLKFDSIGQASGTGGCNAYSSKYEIRDGAVTFTKTISTLMACADQDKMDQEQHYFAALQTASTFQVSGETLTISVRGGSEVMHFTKGIVAK
jgi:heat shock protein HslJ